MSIFRFSSQLFSSFLMLLFLLFRTLFLMVGKSVILRSSHLDMAWTILILFTPKASQSGASQMHIILLAPDLLTVLPLASSRSQDPFTASLVLMQMENNTGHGKLDKGRVARLVPIGRALPGCHQSQGTGFVGRDDIQIFLCLLTQPSWPFQYFVLIWVW